MVTFFKKNLKSRGQATVEYLLLIVVVIAIATGIGGPLGRHLAKFSGALLGPDGYYACLTEKGKLPGTPECSAEGLNLAFNSLNQVSSGDGFSAGGSGNNNSNNNNNNSNNNNSNNDGNDSNDGSNKDGSDSSTGNDSQDGGKSFKSSSSKGKNKKNKRHKAESSSSEDSANSDSASSGSLAGSSAGDSSDSPSSFSDFSSGFSSKNKRKKRRRGRGSVQGRSSRAEKGGEGAFSGDDQGYKRARFRAEQAEGYLGETYAQEIEQEKQEKPVFKAAQAEGPASRTAGSDSKKAGMIADRKPDKKTVEDDKVKSMNFSGFLKYLMIAILVIVVIIVIFSQVMEYQSRD